MEVNLSIFKMRGSKALGLSAKISILTSLVGQSELEEWKSEDHCFLPSLGRTGMETSKLERTGFENP